MVVATIWTIVYLYICLKDMAAWVYQTRSLVLQLNRSILGTHYFLDAQFRDMRRFTISVHISTNSLSSCLRVILKPHCRYILWTGIIPSSILFIFQFMGIIPVANIVCWDIMFSKPIPLMCMRSYHRMTSHAEIWFYDRLHMLDVMEDCFVSQMCHTGSIYVLIHPGIFSRILEDF